MSNLRSAYPQAQAWTFLIDTPPPPASDQNAATPPSDGAGATAAVAAAAAGAAGARGRIRPALAAGVKSGPNKGSGLSSNHSSSSGDGGGGRGEASGSEEMGAMCSKPNSSNSSTNNTLENKENMAEAGEEMPPNGTDQTTMAGGGGDVGGTSSGSSTSSTGGADPEAPGKPGEESTEKGEAAPTLQGTPLASTALLSPDPEEERAASQAGGEVGSLSVADDEGIAVAGLVGGGHAGSNGDGRIEFEDRSAWVARNVGMLPRGGQEVEVDKLGELPGLENCLHELLSERERHLSAMENLTSQLRRREAESTKASHDLKALTARLECAEQDRSGLERRVRAAAEEHRVERARWFVHKQELETRCVQLESRDTQYRASMRKKELEYGRLQDSLRRTVEKSSSMTHRGPGAGGKGGTKGRGIESNLELSPGDTATEGGSQPLGGVLNEQAAWKAEELEAQNASLRSMLIDLQGEVMDLKGYQDRHGDLVSAGRGAAEEGGIWGGRMSVEPLPAEVIEGMPADWLERQFGDEMARQIKGMRGALARVLGDDENEAKGGDAASISQEDMTSIVSQLREARALLREQDAIMFAAIFDRPGASVASDQHACVCGGDGGSGVWDSLERLEQEREELEQERSKLEKDKAKFLEEAVRRDSKSFVFSYPSASPTPGTPVPRDSRYATPVQLRGREEQSGAEGARDLTVATTTPPGANGNGAMGGGGVRDAASMPLMTFTPPTASPHTTKLLGQLGINL